MRLVIIEDDLAIRSTLELMLHLEGYQVQAFERPEQALESLKISESMVDLVLLDLTTDGISSAEFVGELNDMAQRGEILPPRLGVISASVSIESQSAALGADFFVRKPFRVEELLARLSYFGEFSSDYSSQARRAPLDTSSASD